MSELRSDGFGSLVFQRTQERSVLREKRFGKMTDEEKEKDVKRAVEWKVRWIYLVLVVDLLMIIFMLFCVVWSQVFEVQASLLAEDVTEHHMALAKKWIQPVHYSEMVEERYTHGKCGFPTCKKSLVEKRPSSYRDIIDSHSLAIARATNNAGGEVVFPSNYCSEDCFRKSSQFYGEMDRSAPVTRSGVSTLLASQSKIHSGGGKFYIFIKIKYAYGCVFL